MSPTLLWAMFVFAAGVVFAAGGMWVRHQRHGQDISDLKDERNHCNDCLEKLFRHLQIEPPPRRPK